MIKFIIDHIDPLGQGVFKQDEDIYFIPKTLPGEEGILKVLKKSKGVHFCEVIELTKKSPLRIESTCKHFKNCNGCHYLHTNYEEEINFKIKSFNKLLVQLNTPSYLDIEVLKSPSRLGYRNRIQLHYHRRSSSLGFKGYKSSKIISVPDCQIMKDKVQHRYEEIKNSWKSEAKNQKPSGHIEIYQNQDQVKISWNKDYAEGGFSQVNEEVNEKLQDLVSNYIKPSENVLDLFGGNGNLTKKLHCKSKLSVDLYPPNMNGSEKFNLNLFNDDSLELFQSHHPSKVFEALIIDPPRSGFKKLKDWCERYKPNKIVYVSCHPATMIRDLKEITSEYQVISSNLIDLFPATYHYEAMLVLERKDSL